MVDIQEYNEQIYPFKFPNCTITLAFMKYNLVSVCP